MLIALLDLLEAEAASARRGIAVFCFTLMLGLGAGLIALVALALLTWAVYLLLEREMSQIGALFFCALILIGIAGSSLWYIKRILR
ncbi:MAG: hypothetical protein R2940_02295 [Syntrophotaleaceae bacterium]